MQKAVVKHLWIGDPKEFGKGIVKQQSQAPSQHKSTLTAAHQPAYLLPERCVCFGTHLPVCSINVLLILRCGEERTIPGH